MGQLLLLAVQAALFFFQLQRMSQQAAHMATQAEQMKVQAAHMESGLVAANKTAEATKSSADAAVENAHAAAASARAAEQMIARTDALERPWVVFEATDVQGLDMIEEYRTDPEPVETQKLPWTVRLRVRFKLTNSGRSVARITAFDSHFTTFTKLPDDPFKGIDPEITPRLWGPGQSVKTWTGFDALPGFMIRQLLNGDTRIAFYGIVKYRGPIDDDRPDYVSRWCMILRANKKDLVSAAFRFGGPPGYNEYT